MLSQFGRRILDTAAFLVMIAGTLVGLGVVGTRVEQAAGGALAATATLIAPAGPAFSIWSVIYALLAAYVVWLWLPGTSRHARVWELGTLPAWSMVLNGTWLLVVQAGWIWASVADIAALVVVLGLLMTRISKTSPGGLAERILVDGTFGLYLGWVAVATCANVAAALVGQGVTPAAPLAEWLAAAVLAVAAGVGVLLARRLDRSWGVPVAMAWGLAWIAAGRLGGPLFSTIAGTSAILAAIVVVVAFVRGSRRDDTYAWAVVES